MAAATAAAAAVASAEETGGPKQGDEAEERALAEVSVRRGVKQVEEDE